MRRVTPSKPVVIIGYGYRGLEWLVDLRRSLGLDDGGEHAGGGLESIVQFWVVGVDPAEFGAGMRGLWSLELDTSAEALRGKLDQGRSAEIVQKYPEYRVDEVLVLERWSPFEVSSATRRQLHEEMDVCRRNGFRREATPLIRYEWFGLCDAVRAAAPLNADLQEEVDLHFAPDLLPLTNLLIDRWDAMGAVLGLPFANRTYDTLARCLIRALLNGNDGLTSVHPDRVLEADRPTTVRALSLTSYRHASLDLEKVAHQNLRRRLSRGDVDIEASVTETNLASDVRGELRRSAAVTRLTPAERSQKVSQCLAVGMARRLKHDPDAWKDLGAAVREEAASRPTWDVSGDLPRGLDTAQRGWLAHLFSRIRRLFGLEPPDTPMVTEVGRSGAPEDSSRADWVALLAAADDVRNAWEAWVMTGSRDHGPASAWEYAGGAFTITAEPVSAGAADRVTLDSLRIIASRALRAAGRDQPVNGEELFDGLLKSVAKEVVFGAHGEWPHVLDAFAAIGASPGGVRWPAFSLHRGSPPRPQLVLWFSAVDQETLSEVESRSEQPTAVAFAPIAELDESVRLCLSEHVPWNEVLSLHPSTRGRDSK